MLRKDSFEKYLKFGISIINTFCTIFRLMCDLPVVSGGGNQCIRQNKPAYSKSLATFSHAPAGIPNRAVVKDGRQMLGHPNRHIKIEQNFMALNGHRVIRKRIKEICFFFSQEWD